MRSGDQTWICEGDLDTIIRKSREKGMFGVFAFSDISHGNDELCTMEAQKMFSSLESKACIGASDKLWSALKSHDWEVAERPETGSTGRLRRWTFLEKA